MASSSLTLIYLEKEAFVTLKDHKPNFHNHPTCRLINPTKSEIGAISKHILDDINASVITSTKINQWKNTASVLKWFNGLENKNLLSFICFDVCEFCPSINEKLLSKALDFATNYGQITSHEREIILHAKRSLLFSDNCPWEKKISKQPIWHHHGIFRWSWDMWIGWMLSFVPAYQVIWPQHRLIPGRWTGSLQRQTTRNGKDQERHM